MGIFSVVPSPLYWLIIGHVCGRGRVGMFSLAWRGWLGFPNRWATMIFCGGASIWSIIGSSVMDDEKIKQNKAKQAVTGNEPIIGHLLCSAHISLYVIRAMILFQDIGRDVIGSLLDGVFLLDARKHWYIPWTLQMDQLLLERAMDMGSCAVAKNGFLVSDRF